jgi:hypothetical protein
MVRLIWVCSISVEVRLRKVLSQACWTKAAKLIIILLEGERCQSSKSDFQPTSNQPQAIEKLVEGIRKGYKH